MTSEVLMFVAFLAVVLVGLPATYVIGRWHGAQKAPPEIDLRELHLTRPDVPGPMPHMRDGGNWEGGCTDTKGRRWIHVANKGWRLHERRWFE